MIELVLVVFLLAMAVMATVAVKVGMKAVDFIEASYRHYRSLEESQERIVQLLSENPRDGDGPIDLVGQPAALGKPNNAGGDNL